MARARNIKPGFYKNEDLAECTIWARFIFPGMWMLADRDGRLEDRPKKIKGELLPFDAQEIEPLLNELHERGFILRYRNTDGAFIQILKFSTHQSPHYSEKPSVIKPPTLREMDAHGGAPPPSEHRESPQHEAPEKPRTLREDSGKRARIKGGSQPPDSLIPDSLIPESKPLSEKRIGGGDIPADATTERVTALRLLCERSRVSVNVKGRMHLAQWVGENVDETTLAVAIAIARKRKPAPALIPIAYLVPIVEDLKAGRVATQHEPRGADAVATAMANIAAKEAVLVEALEEPSPQPTPEPELDEQLDNGTEESLGALAGEDFPGEGIDWWRTEELVLARGVEEGVVVIPDQEWDDYVARVYAAAGPGPWLEEANADMRARVAGWRHRINPPSQHPQRRQPVRHRG